jgi:hypothetical protein
LREVQADIELAIGKSLEWREEGERCTIRASRNVADLNQREKWAEQHKWLCENLDRFYRVFIPKLEQFDLSN